MSNALIDSNSCIEQFVLRRLSPFITTALLFSLYSISSALALGQPNQIANAGLSQSEIIEVKSGDKREKVKIWSTPAEQKVRPGDEIENQNLVWLAEDKKIKIAGAGNQHAAFQVIISALEERGRYDAAPDGFYIEASSLTSEQGSTIPEEQISFFLQHHIYLTGKSSPIGGTGFWPDALVPIQVPFGMKHKSTNHRLAIWEYMLPIWVDLDIPTGTDAGIYYGTITITQHGEKIESLNLEVEVFDFSLPDETALHTYIGVAREGRMTKFYDKPADSDELIALTRKYQEFLYDRRMEPSMNSLLVPKITVNGERVELEFNENLYHHYMEVLNTKRVRLSAAPHELRNQISAEVLSDDFNRIIQSYVSQLASFYRENGWEDRLLLTIPVDEPQSPEGYETTRNWATMLKESVPNVNLLSTRTPIPHPEFGSLRGYADSFSVHGNHMYDTDLKQVIAEEQAKRGEITWYVSCDQAFPQPNYFIDAPPLDPVMVPWIAERYGMDGILYWEIMLWDFIANPWVDADTSDEWHYCSDGWVLNGEGSLIYPGEIMEMYTGQPNIEGPVSSIRFELLRDGIEDHVYLQMLKDLGDPEFAEEQVRNHVVNVGAFSRNLGQLYITREAMARRIEELSR